MDDVLPYRILDDCSSWADDEKLEPYQSLIAASIAGELSPLAAAEQLTDLVAANGPTADKWTDVVSAAIASAASSFPPCHVAHDTLYRVLDSLTSVSPKRQIRNSVLDNNGEVKSIYEGLEYLLDTRPFIPLWEGFGRLQWPSAVEWLAENGD